MGTRKWTTLLIMEILNFKLHTSEDKTIATFDVNLGPKWGITFKRIRLIKGKKGAFIALPSYSEEIDFKKVYSPYIEMSKEKLAIFNAKVFELLKPFLGNLHD